MPEIKNLKKTAKRILRAIKSKENIILYGDADLDGVTSVIILKESLINLGCAKPIVYFPDREEEDYGINEKALDFLKTKAPALFLALDCGISNFEEIKIAKSIGFEVIIIDHHEILDRLPDAEIIVDPKQKGDKYPFKRLATVGITYKLSEILLGRKLSDTLKKNFLELVALGTIADMMPEEKDNKTMVKEGLSSIENSWRPGLRAFFEIDKVKEAGGIRPAIQKIISALNITTLKNHLNESYLLLTINSFEKAKVLAEELLVKYSQRQNEIKEITERIKGMISKKTEEPIIFEGDLFCHLALIGSVASKICNHYKKPTFIFRKKEKESRGAVRTPAEVDGVELMKKCKKYLISFGGHPQAAGFRIKNENLVKFHQCLLKQF